MSSGADHAEEQLRAFVERIERLIEDRKDINADIAAVKAEAKGFGFNPGAVMDVIKQRAFAEKHGQDALLERLSLIELYSEAVGMGGIGLDALMNQARDKALMAQFLSEAQAPKKLTKRTQTFLALADQAAAARRAIDGGSDNENRSGKR
jgi:uncharacterized protein (UPF0335 family)